MMGNVSPYPLMLISRTVSDVRHSHAEIQEIQLIMSAGSGGAHR